MPISQHLVDALAPWILNYESDIMTWGVIDEDYASWAQVRAEYGTWGSIVPAVDDLQSYAQAVGSMFAEVESFCDDADGSLSWSKMFDPTRCPAIALPYLAQWVGEILPVGLSEAQSRQWIEDNPSAMRGTFYGIARGAQRTLDQGSTQTVLLWPAHKQDGTADLDYVSMITFADQTPDPSATLASAQSLAPFDVMIDYLCLGETTWSVIDTSFTSWGDVSAWATSWAEVLTSRSGFPGWGDDPVLVFIR